MMFLRRNDRSFAALSEHVLARDALRGCTDSVQLEHGRTGLGLQARPNCRGIYRLWTTLAWPVDCQVHDRSFKISLGGVPMTRREGTRMDGRDAFLKKLRRYPADRALMRVGEGRKARDFWDLVEYVLAQR
jgi:hypothetical protein